MFTTTTTRLLRPNSKLIRLVSTVSPPSAPHTVPAAAPAFRNTKMTRLATPAEAAEGPFLTKPMFEHPGYDTAEMHAVKFEHRPVNSFRDAITYNFMYYLRSTFDYFTRYKEPYSDAEAIAIANTQYRMTLEKWLTRFIVLESVAGIPGSVAGFLRHLHSIRMFRRDMGFIETLIDEAYNERMHLLTFLKMGKPTLRTRVMLWFGQGLFANFFFIAYIFSPKTCHRFVGYLEEQAVSTYSRCIRDMELGLCPELENHPVPQIALDYWKLPKDAKMYDLIQYIRADEAKHREVNHTFANLDQNGNDRNPFVLQTNSDKPQPNKTLKDHRAAGWERNDLIL